MRKKRAYTAAVPAITANNQRKVITGVFPEEPELAGDGGVAEVLFILPLPVREAGDCCFGSCRFQPPERILEIGRAHV